MKKMKKLRTMMVMTMTVDKREEESDAEEQVGEGDPPIHAYMPAHVWKEERTDKLAP